ncbi:hypothetical protein O0L34_g12652 [Tuta absoluta]|nr:hypothetical protein O0L34_g12652 [Tuta absoluta]
MEKVDKVPREITCAELQKDVLLLEEQEGSVNFKIGVMLMNCGQKTDDEMLSNERGDEKWERFISLLGDKIRLRGWNRFRGGLDVKGDMTGSHSIYTMHQGHEIMFHVSTMLPFSKDNKQQLERKRHIGNDIVNIVFVDDSAHNAFNPQCVKSHFTHIFAVVSEVEGEGYRLSVYSDDTVPPFGPSLPCPPVFNDPQLFREFLLVKLMNGEKAAFQTPTFALKRQRTLDTLIRDIYAEHCSDHKVPMLSRRALSDVWSGGAGAGGAGAARTERFLHVGQALKLDAVLRGDAPTSLVSTGSGGSRRAPWEGRVWRSAPLPATPVCAEQLAEGRLLLSTTSNTYILEETGTTRVVLRWEGCVRNARVTERAGLFRVGARVIGGGSTTGGAGGAGVYALPIQKLCAGAWAMRPLQDCKHARLPRTKTAHYFDILEQGEGGKTTLAIAVGRRVLLMVEEQKTDSEMGFEYTHIKDIQLSESPVLIKLMDGEIGILVVGYKHHWEILESNTGQIVKRAESSDDNTPRRGTLVNALRIGDERDGQIVLCYNHTCHFERLTAKGLESDGEYDFHWTTVPAAVVCAFPYIMAFAEDLLEIRLVANGSLVHAACIPGLKLLCGRRDIFYVACAPEYIPLTRDIDPTMFQHENELIRQMSKQCGPYSVDEDENNENKERGDTYNQNSTPGRTYSETNSTSSRSSSLSSEHENMRPPLQRMAPISPPSSPQGKEHLRTVHQAAHTLKPTRLQAEAARCHQSMTYAPAIATYGAHLATQLATSSPGGTYSETNSTSSRSSSLSSEHENMRPPLQRMAPISPPSSPQGKEHLRTVHQAAHTRKPTRLQAEAARCHQSTRICARHCNVWRPSRHPARHKVKNISEQFTRRHILGNQLDFKQKQLAVIRAREYAPAIATYGAHLATQLATSSPGGTYSETNSTSSRSSSLSSEHENMRPPLQRMAPISPPSSPQVPENSGRCVRIYKIPQSNLSAGYYQRQSLSADQMVTSYFSDRSNSMRQRLAELRLDSKSRGGGDDENL